MTQGRRLSAIPLLAAALVASACRERPKESAATPAARPAPVEASDVATRERRPATGPAVIWLGLDGLDWELLDRLAAEGKMPNWKRLASEGWTGRLEAFSPLLSPILWTSAATGQPPDVHRVLDFQETDPATGRKVPISGHSRAVPAAWNLASAAGKKIGVVGWWATHPAEEVNGFFVSDRASPLLYEKLPLAGVAFPAALEPGIAQVIERDGRVVEDDLVAFLDVPRSEITKSLAEADRPAGQGRSRDPIAGLARVIGATRVSHRTARDLYDRERPDLLALYLEGTDEVGHLFASYTPPKLDCVSEADFARYSRVVETYYALADAVLGQWMRRAAEDGATLLVHSDHGFKWGADRPCGFGSASWATAAFWHRQEGVVAAWGLTPEGGLTPPRGSARILDIAPTVLALLGLPADPKMPGRAIAPVVRNRPAPSGTLASAPVRRVASEAVTAEKADEYVSKLIALGYLSPSETRPLAPSGGDRPGMTEGAWNNLGVYLRDTRRDAAAARSAFEKSLALAPGYYSALFNMAILERGRGDGKAALSWFFRSVVAAGGDPAPAVLGWARDHEKSGDRTGARAILEKALHSWPANEEIARATALARHRGKDCRAGVDALSRFEATTTNPSTLNVLALLQTCLGNRAEVVRLLDRSLALNPNQPDVVRSLAAAEGN
jgi:predicted AlkP superfamily phosphohydrolase/phosphomutase